MNEKTNDRVRIQAHGQNLIEFAGLTPEEVEKMEGMCGGGYWAKGDGKGRLSFFPGWQPAPNPVKDKEMLPFWRKPRDREWATTIEFIELEQLSDLHSSSIIVQHLCGYDYSVEGYQHNAQVLESFGFECLRSRRGNDGKYWELWFLPGL